MIGSTAGSIKDNRMTTVTVTLTLPEELVRDAREFDLLTEKVIAEILQAEIDRRVNELVNEEIQDYRAEKESGSTPHKQRE
jgi:post-segregation antitoxin (ccd killing protein)